ncbi:MAG TPA: tetratricopeptide repeat protein [Thermoanaerobaculia bacterium]|nr:tetratricopeptide repeat protein [Thermoanaerobaculia bacterium]
MRRVPPSHEDPPDGPLPERLATVLRWPGGEDGEYDRILEAVERRVADHARVLGRERAEAPARLAELLGKPAERREMLVRNHPGFRTWGLLERLLDQVRERTFQDAAAAEELGVLALLLASVLDAGRYGGDLLEDMRSRAWSLIGNARRVRSDLRGSEDAFEQARVHLRRGTGDLLERVQWLDLRASLLRDQRRFGEAERLLRRALKIYRDLGETHRAGAVLVKLSTLHEHAGMPDLAIPPLREALALIDGEQEPRLLLSAWHNLITNLVEAGRYMEAQGLFIEARPLYARFSEGWVRHRRCWIEGRIARGLGQAREAETHLLSARDGFVAGGIAYDAALVSLDLAALYAEQGRASDLEALAGEMLAVFAALEIEREALAAFSFLRRAAAARRATLGVVTSIARWMKRLPFEPEQVFVAPQ